MKLVVLLSLGLGCLTCSANGEGSFESHIQPSGFVHAQHSLDKPYLASGMVMPFWDFIGNAVVSEDFIRLTPDRQSKRGALWNSRPTKLDEWEVTFKFHVHGQGKTLFGDGFAFWYTKDKNVLGEVFGSKDRFEGLGIFFDTYSNQQVHHRRGAYISAMINDGTIQYDHDADGTQQELASCAADIRNLDYDTFARVSYRGNTLKLELDVDNQNTWKTCFFEPDINLPADYFFGFSAATGDLADNHDIVWARTSDPKDLTEAELEEIKKLEAEEAASSKDDEGQKKFDSAKLLKKPFARFHEKARKHVGAIRDKVDFSKKGPILTKLNRDKVSDTPSSFWLMTVLVVVFVGGVAAVIYKVKVLDKSKAQKFEF